MSEDKVSPKDRDVLIKFQSGKRVEDDELPVIESYSTIGIVKFGFSFNKMEIQASLTESGKRLLGLTECRA